MMNIVDVLRARWFDLIHNTDTHSHVPLAGLEVVGNNKSSGHMYFPTLPKSMHALFRALPEANSNTTFIDIGCGKGLTLLVAGCYPFRKIMGVEFSTELHRIAQQNIQRYRGRKRRADTEALCMDAADFQFPTCPLLVYFFNPFKRAVMEEVLSNLASSVREKQREVTVICDTLHDRELLLQYLNPQKTETVLGFSIYSQLRPQQGSEPRRASDCTADSLLPGVAD